MYDQNLRIFAEAHLSVVKSMFEDAASNYDQQARATAIGAVRLWVSRIIEFGLLDPVVKLDAISFMESHSDALLDSPYPELMRAYSQVARQAGNHSALDARHVMEHAVRYSFRVLRSHVALRLQQPDRGGIRDLLKVVWMIGKEFDALDAASNILVTQHEVLRAFGFHADGSLDRSSMARAFDVLPAGCRSTLADAGDIVRLSGRSLEVRMSSSDTPVRLNEVGSKMFAHPVMVVHIENLFSAPASAPQAEAFAVVRALIVDAFMDKVRSARSCIYHLEQYVDASASHDGPFFPCRVIDLSRGGISVMAPTIALPEGMRPGSAFHFFWVDGSTKHHIIEGCVRWLSSNDGESRIGISFTQEHAGAFPQLDDE